MAWKDFHRCEACRLRAHADRKPNGLLARLWRWHTRWCPGWKRYQRWLAAKEAQEADAGTGRGGKRHSDAHATDARGWTTGDP